MRLPWPPILLHYYVTYRCNCKCTFCDIWQSPDLDHSLFADLESVRENLRQGKRLGTRFVDYTGGEPLLHPQLADMLDIAKSMGYTTSVTTNGLLYEQKAASIRGKVDLLHFSIDSLNPHQHNSIRGKNVYTALLKAIDKALELGETPDLLFTVTPQNIAQLPAMASFSQQLKLMLIVNPVFSHIQQHNLSDAELSYIEQFQRRPYIYINRAFHQFRRKGGNKPENPRCRVTSSTVVISPDNCLLLPCFHHQQEKIPINGQLYDLYHSRQIQSSRMMEGKYDFCTGCVLNCYMDPSFLYKADSLMWASLQSKTKYTWDKYVRRPIQQRIENTNASALEIAVQCQESRQ